MMRPVEQRLLLLKLVKRRKEVAYHPVFDHVTTDMRLAWEEPFGQLPVFIRVSSVEGSNRSNESEFGLQGAVFTRLPTCICNC